jgi:O-succinylbenzoic acid--CoA ligase
VCFESYGMTETYSHVAVKNLSLKENYFTCLDGVTCEKQVENIVIFANHISTNGIKTNDCVNLIDSKHFELLGRSDFVINSAGYKFHPEVLEEKLEKVFPFPFFILGEKNLEFGEIVTFYAEITYSPEQEKTINEAFLANLNRYEIPKKTYFVDKFCSTTSGKVNKLETQKRAFEH